MWSHVLGSTSDVESIKIGGLVEVKLGTEEELTEVVDWAATKGKTVSWKVASLER